MGAEREYVAIFKGVTINASQDLFEITAPADATVRVYEYRLWQVSDVGDAQEEILSLDWVRGKGTTSGSGGTTVTPQSVSDGHPAFGGTVEANNTTPQSGGTKDIVGVNGWNIRQPDGEIFLEKYRPEASPGDRIALFLVDPPADAIVASGMVRFVEIGG